MFPYVRELFRSPCYRCIRAGDALYNKDIVVSPKNSCCKHLCLLEPTADGTGALWAQGTAGQPGQDPSPLAHCCLGLPAALRCARVLGVQPQEGPVLRSSVGCIPELLPRGEGRRIRQSQVFAAGKPPKRGAGKKQRLLPNTPHQLSACLGAQRVQPVAATLTPSLPARGTTKCVWPL